MNSLQQDIGTETVYERGQSLRLFGPIFFLAALDNGFSCTACGHVTGLGKRVVPRLRESRLLTSSGRGH